MRFVTAAVNRPAFTSTPYGAGNRGLEYSTTPGGPAHASAPGRVTFAGQVGGQLHVVVQHADGVRTSYSFLRTIAVRAGPDTQHVINADMLRKLGPDGYLVNISRGPIVEEAALVAALRSGHLAGAGLDVFDREPLPADHPFRSLDNVVVTPHVAWLTPQTLARSLGVAVENCRRLLTGEPLLNQVAP